MAEAAEYKKYQELTFDLGTARTDEELEISGDFILVEYLDGSAYIKLDNPGHDAIDLSRIKQIKTSPQKFNKIYITNTAQSGKTLKLLIGGAASFTAEATKLGEIKISGYTATDIFHGQVDVGTTEVQLTTETDCLSITIKADDDNTDDVYIGKSGVTTSNGLRLRPGQAITIYISNPSVLYAISGTAGQKVYILGEK